MGVTRPYAAIPLQLHLPRELPSTAIGGAILQPELPSCVSKQGQHQGEPTPEPTVLVSQEVR